MSTQPGHHWLDREDQGAVTVVRFRLRRLFGEENCREVFALLYGLVDEVVQSRKEIPGLDRATSLADKKE